MSFKTILGGFIFSTITKVDHIPSIAKASCYLTCIKHAFKHPQTPLQRTMQTDRHTERQTHTLMQRTMRTDRQTDTHTHTCMHAHTFAENCTDRHTHTRTHTPLQRTMQPDSQADKRKRTQVRIQQGYSRGTVRVQQGYSKGTAGYSGGIVGTSRGTVVVGGGCGRIYRESIKNNAKTSICVLYLL